MRKFLIYIYLFFSSNLFAQVLIDTDGDGIPDIEDHCPTVKGPKENNGCQWEEIVCYGPMEIKFSKDNIDLSKEEKENLKDYAKVLLRDIKPSDFEKITIISHTSRNSDKQKLKKIALKRAKAVKKYLVSFDKKFKVFTIVLKMDKDLKWTECEIEACPEWKYAEEDRITFGLKEEKPN